MPFYEYRCRTCDDRFDLRRAADDADRPAPCPAGHTDTVRLLAAFASTGRASAAGDSSASTAAMPAGGCGTGCACAP